jgi:hypothetical protein
MRKKREPKAGGIALLLALLGKDEALVNVIGTTKVSLKSKMEVMSRGREKRKEPRVREALGSG